MRVVVLGAGALGSVYGAWLADAGADVTLVARRPTPRRCATGASRFAPTSPAPTCIT